MPLLRVPALFALGGALLSCAGGRAQDEFSAEGWLAQVETKLAEARSVRVGVRVLRRGADEALWAFETKGADRLHFRSSAEIEGWDEGRRIYVREGAGAPLGRDWPPHEARCLLVSIVRSGVYGWQLSHAADPGVEVRVREPALSEAGNDPTVKGRQTVVIEHGLECGREGARFGPAGRSRVWIDLEARLPFRRQTRTPSGEEWIERYQWHLDEPMDDARFHAPGAPAPGPEAPPPGR